MMDSEAPENPIRLKSRLDGFVSLIQSAPLAEVGYAGYARNISQTLMSMFEADAAFMYHVEEYGFSLLGCSEHVSDEGVANAYVPLGSGILTIVARQRRAIRLHRCEASDNGDAHVVLDLDSQKRVRVHSDILTRYDVVLSAPVFSYDRVVAVLLVCWTDGRDIEPDDTRLISTVAEYLSSEIAAAVSQIDNEKTIVLNNTANSIIETTRSSGYIDLELANDVSVSIMKSLAAHVMVIEEVPASGNPVVRRIDGHVVDGPDVLFPYSIDSIFDGHRNVVSIDESSPEGMWVARHTNLNHGFAIRLCVESDQRVKDGICLFILRGQNEREFDDIERGFIRRVGNEVAKALKREQKRVNDEQISNALQAGLRNELTRARGVSCSSLYISATSSAVVGGDFFDLYDLSLGNVVVVIGDVSGKGVEAAAMASLVKTALAAYAWDRLDPASMLSSLNSLLNNFSRLEKFASMVVVSIDLSTCTATYCSGGHPPAMVVHSPSGPKSELELLTVQSPVVGAFEGLEYTNGTFTFERGDVLYLYTDGTTEARAANGEFFGEDGLRDALLRACKLGIEQVPEYILDEVSRFAGGDIHDDIAMVALRFDGLTQMNEE